MIQKNGAGVSPEIEDVWPTGEWPKHCGTQMVGVEYDYTSPERYDRESPPVEKNGLS